MSDPYGDRPGDNCAPYGSIPDLTEEGRERWLSAVEKCYGLRLRYENDLYLETRSGRIYAGSEYVATANEFNPDDPDLGRKWADRIGAFERIGGNVELRTFARVSR